MRKQELLRQLIRARSNGLKNLGKINGEALLCAVLYCESKMGKKAEPRQEPAYMPSGSMFTKEFVRSAYEDYGEDAASSYGPWQVPYLVARQLGFKDEPSKLADPETNIEFVIEFLNQRCNHGPITISQIADCYSKNYIDRKVPHTYIRRFIQAYNGKSREWLDGRDI